MKVFFSIFIALLLGPAIMAQDYVFSTLAVNGTCMIQRGDNPDEFVRVEKGIKVYIHDKIIVTGADSYIGLVAISGKVTEIKSSGVFASEDLVASLVKGDASLANDYTQVLTANVSSTKYDQAQYNMYTGTSVNRSVENNEIELFLPVKTKVSDNPSTISWMSKKTINSFKVSITNLYEEEVYTSTTSEHNLAIDFSSIELFPGQVYRITVADAGNTANKSNEVALHIPTRSDMEKYQTDLSMLQNEVPENSAIGDMVFATYFEEQGLFLQAIPYYKSAIEKEPKILEYKHAYDVFLYKVGLEK